MPASKTTKKTKAKETIKKQRTTKVPRNDKKSTKGAEKKIEKKAEKKGRSNLQKAVVQQKNIKIPKEDKMLEKIERYVDENREKTSKEIMERKKKRTAKNYKKGDLDVLISRVSIESKPKENTKEISKWIVYSLYLIIIIAILIFMIKFFFTRNLPQNG